MSTRTWLVEGRCVIRIEQPARRQRVEQHRSPTSADGARQSVHRESLSCDRLNIAAPSLNSASLTSA